MSDTSLSSSTAAGGPSLQCAGTPPPLFVALRDVGGLTYPVSSFEFQPVARRRRDDTGNGTPQEDDDLVRTVLSKKTLRDLACPGTTVRCPVTLTITGRLCRGRDVRFDTSGTNGVTFVGLWLEEVPHIQSHSEWRDAADGLRALCSLIDGVDTRSAFDVEASGALKLYLRGVRAHTGPEALEGFSINDCGEEQVVAHPSELPYGQELTAEFQLLCFESGALSPRPMAPFVLLFLQKLAFATVWQ
ncbi:hypothetical protein EIP86_007175 [Pleurotus ostreatoroseus]|nr:hypothetical protein EIP86_007175 [Pleurotus ostreatoroseus]